jgi:hypothetical protein
LTWTIVNIMAEPYQAAYATDEVSELAKRFLPANFFSKYGRPFIILREQAKKTRRHGVGAIKVRVLVLGEDHKELTGLSGCSLIFSQPALWRTSCGHL